MHGLIQKALANEDLAYDIARQALLDEGNSAHFTRLEWSELSAKTLAL
jgi:hypothetical protein